MALCSDCKSPSSPCRCDEAYAQMMKESAARRQEERARELKETELDRAELPHMSVTSCLDALVSHLEVSHALFGVVAKVRLGTGVVVYRGDIMRARYPHAPTDDVGPSAPLLDTLLLIARRVREARG